ncbi:hypothetical protein NEMIN01_1119 [Nematocida minor]|uniref:uncharacterized protein n=1 Tax=Nematocida minor TaxID=1912983 RepID=UPI00221F53C7|nr:uncharacterized protein NEMIN01_1119 [Nematocida minor]KAI5190581.1 hypothetical protein NEMIN01_1119 [Nematocida minor]
MTGTQKTRIRFPCDLTEPEKELREDLLEIFGNDELQAEDMVYKSIERIKKDVHLLKDMITVECPKKTENITNSDKIENLFTIEWLVERDDEILHFLCMMQNNKNLLGQLNAENSSAEDRIAAFFEAAGARITHWADVACAIRLIKPKKSWSDLKRGLKHFAMKGSQSASANREESGELDKNALLNRNIQSAYMALLYEIIFIRDSNEYWYSKSVLQKYFHNMCRIAEIKEESIADAPLESIFEETDTEINIKSILKKMHSAFSSEIDRKRHVLEKGEMYELDPKIVKLLASLKSVLANWEGIVCAEAAIREFFFCNDLWPAFYQLDKSNPKSLELLHRKVLKYLGYHMQDHLNLLLDNNAELQKNSNAKQYLMRIYSNLRKFITAEAGIAAKIKDVMFSPESEYSLDEKSMCAIEEYVVEEVHKPFEAKPNDSKPEISVNRRDSFVISDEVVDELVQDQWGYRVETSNSQPFKENVNVFEKAHTVPYNLPASAGEESVEENVELEENQPQDSLSEDLQPDTHQEIEDNTPVIESDLLSSPATNYTLKEGDAESAFLLERPDTAEKPSTQATYSSASTESLSSGYTTCSEEDVNGKTESQNTAHEESIISSIKEEQKDITSQTDALLSKKEYQDYHHSAAIDKISFKAVSMPGSAAFNDSPLLNVIFSLIVSVQSGICMFSSMLAYRMIFEHGGNLYSPSRIKIFYATFAVGVMGLVLSGMVHLAVALHINKTIRKHRMAVSVGMYLILLACLFIGVKIADAVNPVDVNQSFCCVVCIALLYLPFVVCVGAYMDRLLNGEKKGSGNGKSTKKLTFSLLCAVYFLFLCFFTLYKTEKNLLKH